MTTTTTTTYASADVNTNATKTVVVNDTTQPGPQTTITIVVKATELAKLSLAATTATSQLTNLQGQVATVQAKVDSAAASIAQINALT